MGNAAISSSVRERKGVVKDLGWISHIYWKGGCSPLLPSVFLQERNLTLFSSFTAISPIIESLVLAHYATRN